MEPFPCVPVLKKRKYKQDLIDFFVDLRPRKEVEWQHAQAAGNGTMKTVLHCHKMFGPT